MVNCKQTVYVVTVPVTAGSSGADDTTSATTPTDVVTTSQAAAVTTNPGVSLRTLAQQTFSYLDQRGSGGALYQNVR